MARPVPTMTPERIGTIGNTQGVNESSSPNPKKLAITSQNPPSNTRAMVVSSAAGPLPKNHPGAASLRAAPAASDASRSSAYCSRRT
jgi:hypothetical protein